MYELGVCTNQEFVLNRIEDMCINKECVLTRNVY